MWISEVVDQELRNMFIFRIYGKKYFVIILIRF